MEIPELASEEIKKILNYKEVFESKAIKTAFAAVQEPDEFFAIENVEAFLTQLDVSGFNLIFDYPAWLNEQTGDILTDVNFLKKADMQTLRKVMTAHVRTERFASGHLKEQFENGYMASFFVRLEELYQQMK